MLAGRALADRLPGATCRRLPSGVNYLQREAGDRSLGGAGEEFVVRFEQARLTRAGRESLASKVDRVSISRGDGAGSTPLLRGHGSERLIEVKTTKYGRETPFFCPATKSRRLGSMPTGTIFTESSGFEWSLGCSRFMGRSLRLHMEPTLYVATVA